MDGLRLVEATDLDAAGLARLRVIYEDGFEPALRSPFDGLLRDRALALLDGDRPCGLAVLRDLDASAPRPWAFLRYYVVGDRGRGLGSTFWELLRAAHPDHARIVLDVEDPDEPGTDDAERSLRRRRIGFYERLGVVHLPVEHYEPPHDGRPQPLRLMLTDLGSAGTPMPTADDLRDVVRTVYRGRYGLADDDPAVVACLRASGLS